MAAERLALGTAQFGMAYGVANRTGKVAPHEVSLILSEARAARMDTMDTAIAYGDSEQVLGGAGVVDWRLVSKVPRLPVDPGDVEEWVRTAVIGSLLRLRVTRLAGLLLHRPEDLLEAHGTDLWEALLRVREEGLVERIGYSIYSPCILEQLWHDHRPQLVQAPFNVFDRRLQESGWLARLHGAGVEVHARSVFLQGLLLMQPAARPPWFDRWREAFARWHEWLLARDVGALSGALHTVLAVPQLDRVVVGVNSATQLREIIATAETEALAAPAEFAVADEELIEPSRWSTL